MNIWNKRILLIFVSLGTICLAIVTSWIVIIQPQVKKMSASRYVVPLETESFIEKPSGEFMHYYEPAPSSVYAQSAEWLTEPVIHHINKDGVHSESDYSIEKEPGVYRIVTMGDSFTFGSFVHTKENWSSVLEKKLNGQTCKTSESYEVINLGVEGYDIGYAAERYLTKGVRYSPDVVIWLINGFNFYSLNDLSWDARDAYAKGTVATVSAQTVQTSYYAVSDYVLSVLLQRMSAQEIFMKQKAYIQRVVDAVNVPLIIAMTVHSDPQLIRLIQDAARNHPNVYIFDALPDLNNTNSVFPDGHPNVLGHARISDATFSYVWGAGLVGCNPD